MHPLIRGARKHFDSGRKVEEGEYLRPYKKLRVDVTVSMACLDQALDFANGLFNALEARGHRVVEGPANQALNCADINEREKPSKQREHRYPRPLRPDRPTVVYIGTLAIGLAIIEMSEEVLIRYVGGGKRLRLVAYSPYRAVSWST